MNQSSYYKGNMYLILNNLHVPKFSISSFYDIFLMEKKFLLKIQLK